MGMGGPVLGTENTAMLSMRYWVPFLSQDTVTAADLYSQRLEIASRRVGFLTSGMRFENLITFYIKIIVLLCIKITQGK
jgi:hypothetical protein